MAINKTNVELSNSRILDDSIFSGAEGSSSGSYVSPEMIQASADLTKTLIQNANNPSKKELKAACGSKPLCLIGGKCGDKKNEYKKCVNDFVKSRQRAVSSQQSYTPPSYNQSARMDKDEVKFLGMPVGVGITVSVVVLAGLGFGAFKLIQKLKN